MKMLVVGAMAGLIVLSPAAGAKTLVKLPANLDPIKAYALVEVGNTDDAKIKVL